MQSGTRHAAKSKGESACRVASRHDRGVMLTVPQVQVPPLPPVQTPGLHVSLPSVQHLLLAMQSPVPQSL